jgi:hypothetical protein
MYPSGKGFSLLGKAFLAFDGAFPQEGREALSKPGGESEG